MPPSFMVYQKCSPRSLDGHLAMRSSTRSRPPTSVAGSEAQRARRRFNSPSKCTCQLAGMGHSRRFGPASAKSGPPPRADFHHGIIRPSGTMKSSTVKYLWGCRTVTLDQAHRSRLIHNVKILCLRSRNAISMRQPTVLYWPERLSVLRFGRPQSFNTQRISDHVIDLLRDDPNAWHEFIDIRILPNSDLS